MNRNSIKIFENHLAVKENLKKKLQQERLLNEMKKMPKEKAVIRWFAFRDDDDREWGENSYDQLLSGFGVVKHNRSAQWNRWKAGEDKYLEDYGDFLCDTLNYDGSDSYQGIRFVFENCCVAWYYATAEEVGKYYHLDQELWQDETYESYPNERGRYEERKERNYEEMFGMSDIDSEIHFMGDFKEDDLKEALRRGEGKINDCDGWHRKFYRNWNNPMYFTKESLREWGEKYPYGEEDSEEIPDAVSW